MVKKVDPKSMEPDDVMSLEELPLMGIEEEARTYWRRFLPKLCRSLSRQGPTSLDWAIRKASHRMEYQTGLILAESPKLHREQALRLTRYHLFPSPERRTTRASDTPTTN